MADDFITLDLETTGLGALDRIVEIGLVRTSPSGRLIEEYTTLVNPQRDIGPTRIHGISAGEVRDAPDFREIASDVAGIMNGAVLVAHNAVFDRRFLERELRRAGREFEELETLCTLELVRYVFPGGPRRLSDCCVELGISMGEAHHALDDARMTSDLLHRLLGRAGVPFEIRPVWISPDPRSSRPPRTRGQARLREDEGSYLEHLVSRLDARNDTGVLSAAMVGQYFNLLDRVLEDRRLDPEEAEALHSFASELCFSRDRVTTLHASYMATLCAVARGDGVVSDSEHSDLQTVATLLSVADWESLLGTEDPVSVQPQLLSGLNSGMTVCFTGDSEVSRANLVSLAESIGLVVKPGVSKKLDLLVVADPDSASGKAKKAREYGIRIMTVGVFLSMLPEPELGQDRFSRP